MAKRSMLPREQKEHVFIKLKIKNKVYYIMNESSLISNTQNLKGFKCTKGSLYILFNDHYVSTQSQC